MKFLWFFFLCVIDFIPLIASLAVTTGRLSHEAESAWEALKEKHPHKFTTSAEVSKRRTAFVAAAATIQEIRSQNPSYTVAYTDHAILTPEERNARLGRLNPPASSVGQLPAAKPIISASAPPVSLDLRTTTCGAKMANNVKDQGYCGSCWAYSTIAPIEYAQCVKSGGTYTSLSEQQIISCDTNDNGCGGGNPYKTFNWLLATQKGAVITNASYPLSKNTYNGITGSCKKTGLTTGATLKSWAQLPGASYTSGGNAAVTTGIQNAIVTYGTLATCFLVPSDGSFDYYTGGVYSSSGNAKTSCTLYTTKGTKNHCTALVGWGVSPSNGPYWIMRNQWGTSWGMKGYMYIKRGVNMCGVESEVFYATV